jgi:hypothetical protein
VVVIPAFLLACGLPQASTWVERLGDDDPAERHRAAAVLDRAAEEAVPALLAGLRAAGAEVRGRSAELLERRAARSDVSRLRLNLEVRDDGPSGSFRGTLRIENPGEVPVLLHRFGLRVSGVSRQPPVGEPFVSLGAGGAHEESIEGLARVPGLHPEPFYVGPGPVVVGKAPVRILKLQNEDPIEVAAVLLELFSPQGTAVPPIQLAADQRTRSIVLSGGEDLLRVAAEVVGKLDGDPAASETYVLRLTQVSAEDLARTLERLLRPRRP